MLCMFEHVLQRVYSERTMLVLCVVLGVLVGKTNVMVFKQIVEYLYCFHVFVGLHS